MVYALWSRIGEGFPLEKNWSRNYSKRRSALRASFWLRERRSARTKPLLPSLMLARQRLILGIGRLKQVGNRLETLLARLKLGSDRPKERI